MGAAFEGSWSLDENGFEKMESGINGRAIDFAKFGRLFLDQGSVNGVQVIPPEWVLESSTPHTINNYAEYYGNDHIFKDEQGFYKYMWWGIERGNGERDFMALGNHGQIIYISPLKDLIIVRFGESYGEFGSFEGWVEMMYDFATQVEE